MTARHAAIASPREQRIAEQITRHVLDLRLPRLDDAALAAAVRILADAEIAAGLRASAALAAIATMHQPRTWGGTSRVTVCDRCSEAWPCETVQLLRDAQTPARPGLAPAGPSGLPDARTGDAQGEAVAGPGHQPDWDGNRCANCNARLSDGDPYCPMARAATDELEAVR